MSDQPAADLVARLLRRAGDETQLTSALGRLMRDSPPLAAHTLRALLRATGTASLTSALPAEVRLHHEQQAVRTTVLGRPRTLGRVDWLFSGPGLFIVVEVKLNAALGDLQLERYLRDERVRSAPIAGVAVLSKQPLTIPSSVNEHKRWLGATTWPDVLDTLGEVGHVSGVHAEAWRAILGAAGTIGDTVADLPAWGHLMADPLALRVVLRAAVEEAMVSLRPKLRAVSNRGATDAELLSPSRSRSASVKLRLIGVRSVVSPVQITLSPADRGISVALQFRPPRPGFRSAWSQEVGALVGAGWGASRGLLTRSVLVERSAVEPHAAVAAVLRAELTPLCTRALLARYHDLRQPPPATAQDVARAAGH